MASRQGAAAAGDRLMTAEQLMRLAEADVKAAGKAERKVCLLLMACALVDCEILESATIWLCAWVRNTPF